MTNTNGNKRGVKIDSSTVLQTTWSGLPGKILLFPVALALSGQMVNEREQLLAKTSEERAESLLDFRLNLYADIANSKPLIIDENALLEALDIKHKEIAESNKDKTEGEVLELQKKARLTDAEIKDLTEEFPEWAEICGDLDLPDAIREYFGQRRDGRQIFQLLIETVVKEFWVWATPRPTISVSAFMQSKQLTSIITSGS